MASSVSSVKKGSVVIRFANVLVDEWIEADRVGDPKAKAYPESILRNSDAGDCLRKLWYESHGYDPEPMDESGLWVTGIGSILHAEWQQALVRRFSGAIVEVEAKVAYLTPGTEVMLTSGHLDATVSEFATPRRWMTAIEVKTIGGVGFRQAVGAPSGYGKAPEAKGPRRSAVRQLAINALMADADEARLVYLATEGIGKGKGFDGVDRFAAEWVWMRDEFEPIARDELARFERAVNSETLPFPEFEGAIVNPPGEGAWICAYCPFQKQCLHDSQGVFG